MSSVWTQTANRPKFPPLEGDLNTDVLIVGGGIAGLLCAHRLRQAQFHPLKFLSAIAEGLPIHEHTKVLAERLKEDGVLYDEGKLWNKNMIARILGDERYIGVEPYPAIIDRSQFDAVAVMRASKQVGHFKINAQSPSL